MDNPLLQPWTGAYGGVPAFDKYTLAEFVPALETGMQRQRSEFENIARNSKPATFDNTILAMEKSGQPLARAAAVYAVWASNISTPEFRKIESVMAPKLAAFTDALIQTPGLYARIKTVLQSADRAGLNAEQKRLTWYVATQFEKAGAGLDETKKKELTRLNQELAKLYTKFRQNQLGDEESEVLEVTDDAQMKGLSLAMVAAARAEAERRKLTSKYAFANTRSAIEPVLVFADDRGLRERAFNLWTRRGDMGGARDNNATVVEILKLRRSKANLLGFPTFAHWRMSDTMAKDPEVALALLMKVWAASSAQFKKDVVQAQALADKDNSGTKFKIAPWDFRYYAAKVRSAKYSLDAAQLTPYLQLDKVRDAMFWLANELYGLTFTKVEGVPVFQGDVTTYQVKRGDTLVGLWYFDPYARAGKQSGAWMTSYRDQQRATGNITTLVSNNSNFIKPGGDAPVTLSWDDVRTMFHEFGHALHGLNSNVTYPTLSGTNTARDFVEFPSQFHENFVLTPQILKFFVNVKGEPLPSALVEGSMAAKNFNQGFETSEALASAIVDLKIHMADPATVVPKEFEKTALSEIKMPDEMVMRHRIPAFGHIFSNEEYAAGYYSYTWSDVLASDAWEKFTEATNAPYNKDVEASFRVNIMSVGNTVDPAETYRKFRGRDPQPEALLRAKGFLPPVAK